MAADGSIYYTRYDNQLRQWEVGKTGTDARSRGVDLLGYSSSNIYVTEAANSLGEVILGIGGGYWPSGFLLSTESGSTLIAATSEPRFSLLYEIDINDQSEIVFQASRLGSEDRIDGLYRRKGDEMDVVLSAGQSLFGAELHGFQFAYGGLNSKGEIAFNYWLLNGERGVAIARPVPEPATGALFAMAFAAGAIRRRRWGW